MSQVGPLAQHAFECLNPCKRCKGTGESHRIKKGRKQTIVCPHCSGSGSCYEWRGEAVPPAAPCRQPDCCICSGRPCELLECPQCYRPIVDPTGNKRLAKNEGPLAWRCAGGSCPRCGSKYVEWLSFDVEPLDVFLTVEWRKGGRRILPRECFGRVVVRKRRDA